MSHAPPSNNEEYPSELEPKELPRILGLFDAMMVVVGSIIGSGIFVKVGKVATNLNDFGLIIGVWIVVGLVTLCGSLALAELCAMLPKAGGPYVFLREAYGSRVAFLWGWTEFWVVRTGSLGALACASVIYLNQAILINTETPMLPEMQELVAIAIVLGLSAVNYYSTNQGALVQNITAVIKVAFLAGIIVLPFLMGKTDTANLAPSNTLPVPSLLSGLGLAMIAVLWPYDGWINIGPVAEEIKEPQRNLPRGLALGMLVVVLVYVGANISYHLTLPMDAVAGTETIASDVFSRLFGKTGGTIAALGVMISTFGAVNSNMMTGPRIYFAMARDGALPQAICAVHKRYNTPANAIVIQAVWTVVLLIAFHAFTKTPKEAFDKLTDSVILAGLIFYSLTVGAVYVLRIKQPTLDRPYRTWGYPITPALLIGVYAYVFVATLIDDWTMTFAVLGLIGAGVIYDAIRSWFFSAKSQ